MIEELSFSQENQLPEIFSLSEEQENSIKEKIKDADGFARVLVHPYFDKHFNNEKYYKALKKLVSGSKEDGIPIILFESEEGINKTMEELGDDLLKNTLVIKTRTNSPVPELESSEEDVYAESGVKKDIDDLLGVCQILKDDFGLNRVIVGGQYLIYQNKGGQPIIFDGLGMNYINQKHVKERKQTKQYQYVEGCVGAVAEAMARTGIKTDLSLISNKSEYGR